MISKLISKTYLIEANLKIDLDFSNRIMEPSIYLWFDNDTFPTHSLIFYYSLWEQYTPNTCKVFTPYDERSVEFYLN